MADEEAKGAIVRIVKRHISDDHRLELSRDALALMLRKSGYEVPADFHIELTWKEHDGDGEKIHGSERIVLAWRLTKTEEIKP